MSSENLNISVTSSVDELKRVNVSITEHQSEIKKLKKRAQDLEKNIISYLNEKEQVGAKYQNTAIIIKNTTKKINVSRKDSQKNICRILEENGVKNATEIINKINESKKGEQIQIQKVVLQKI